MYNPQRFKSTDKDEAFEFMQNHPFATIITVVDEKPFVSHLPLTIKRKGDETFLIGHFARGNPHSQFITRSPVTVLFHGPHTYITPQWYTKNDVPTWNYLVVQVIGEAERIKNYEETIECLKDLTHQSEKQWPSGWEFYIPEDLQGENLLDAIVGFQVKINEINFKKKLSQNRSFVDFEAILKGLDSRTDENSLAIRKYMKKLRS